MATASSTVYVKLDPDTRQLLVRLIHAIEKLQPPTVGHDYTFAESPDGPPEAKAITDEEWRHLADPRLMCMARFPHGRAIFICELHSDHDGPHAAPSVDVLQP